MLATERLTLRVSNLSFVLVFRDDGDAHGVSFEDASETGGVIVLHNFKNVLGTSLNRTTIATVHGRPVTIALFVEAVGDAPRVLSYTLYWEPAV